jgi:hypothetical protein
VNATATQTSTSPTPILDRVIPLPKIEGRLRSSLVSIGIWWSFAAAFGAALIFWHNPFFAAILTWVGSTVDRLFSNRNAGTPFLFAAYCFAGLFAAIAIHELGHALAGVAVGFHFNSLRIGPLQFDRPFRISRYRGKGTGAGGWASLLPVKQDHLILRTVTMLLAGPGSNLVSLCLLLLLPYTKGPGSLWFVYWSGLLGIFNLLPFRSRAVISDGGRILMLLRNRARGERWLAMLKLVEELRTGVPYEKLAPGFLAKAIAIEDNSPDTVVAYALAYGAAFWQRKDDEAARALETCLRHSSLASPSQRQGLMTDAAVFQARRRKRVDLAQQWLADVAEKGEYPWMRPRGEAAILEAEGDIAGALKRLDEIEKMILAFPNQALREISLNGLRHWKSELSTKL